MRVNMDDLFLQEEEELKAFLKSVDEKIVTKQQQLKECRKNDELKSKLAHENKTNLELTQQLAELNRRVGDLDRICAAFSSGVSIAERDQKRLGNAKEMYQLAKELTGIRIDFTAPPNIAKGYLKNEARKVLQPFELQAGDSEALWELIRSTACDDILNSHEKEKCQYNAK